MSISTSRSAASTASPSTTCITSRTNPATRGISSATGSPPRRATRNTSDTTLVGILSTRAKTHELMVECLERGVDVSDVATAEYFPDFIKNEKKRYVEVKARLDAATR